MNVNQRIIQFYSDHLKMRPIDFARAIGMSKQVISGLEYSTTFPGFRFFEGVAKTFPELNIRWLILGEGNMLLDAVQVPENKGIIVNGNGTSNQNNIHHSNTEKDVLLLKELLRVNQLLLEEKERTIKTQEALINALSK